MYRVYIVELDPAATDHAGASGVVYVAETALPPEDRFALDKSGTGLASATVTRHGIGLRSDLAPERTYGNREDVVRAVRRVRRRLEKRGYTVLGRSLAA